MTNNDQMESLRLQVAITDIQAKLSNGGASDRSSTSMLVKMLNDAKQELISVEAKSHQHNEDERRKTQAEVAAVVYLVAQETALNEQEREQYGAFIARDFFTKTDFDALEKFYAHSWDKLTEGGKAQMSQRVWEGVRRHEYEFTELPDPVKEKEAQSIRDMFAGVKRLPPKMGNIPINDRSDFTKAWDAGQKEEAYAVLDRPSFAANVAVANTVGLAVNDAARPVSDRAALAATEIQHITPKNAPENSVKSSSDAVLSLDVLAKLNGPSSPTELPSGSSGTVVQKR